MVVVQQCPKCELRFAIANQLLDHLATDHAGFRHDYTPRSAHAEGDLAPVPAPVSQPVAGAAAGAAGGGGLLVVANQTLGSPTLRALIADRAHAGVSHVTVIAPRAPRGFASLDTAMAAVVPSTAASDDESRRRLHDCLQQLASLGVVATGKLTDADPLPAIQQAVGHHDVDEIIVSTKARTVSHWWHQDLPTRIGRHAGRPVTVVVDDP